VAEARFGEVGNSGVQDERMDNRLGPDHKLFHCRAVMVVGGGRGCIRTAAAGVRLAQQSGGGGGLAQDRLHYAVWVEPSWDPPRIGPMVDDTDRWRGDP